MAQGDSKSANFKQPLLPQDLLDFVELTAFTRRWEQLGLDVETDLLALQLAIMADPEAGRVVAGADGLRKTRFAPTRWNTGKSGAVRVLYVYFREIGVVLLCLVYGKNEIDNISEAVKQRLAKTIGEIEQELRKKKDA